jgi:hypothetical protein
MDGLRNWFRGKKVAQGSQGIVQKVMPQERSLKKADRGEENMHEYIDD